MSNLQEYAARRARSSAATRRSSRSSTSAISPIPRRSSPDWRAYFDSLRGGAADVAHAPVIDSFIQLAKNRKVAGAMVDATTMHKQVLVLLLIGKFRTLGMFHADLDPLKRQEKPYIADLDLATYGFTAADLDTEFDVGSFKAGRGADAPARSDRRAQGHVLPHARRRVHVHPGNGDQALHPGRAWSPSARSPRTRRRAAAAHPRASHRGGDARALPAHEVRRPEALLRRGRPDDDPDARPPDPERRRRGHSGDRDRHGAPRAAQRARQHAGQDAGRPLLGIRGQVRAGASRPATSSTTRASRRTWSRRADRCT